MEGTAVIMPSYVLRITSTSWAFVVAWPVSDDGLGRRRPVRIRRTVPEDRRIEVQDRLLTRDCRPGPRGCSGTGFESRDCLFSPHRGEVVQELIEAIAGCQVVEKVLHRHPRSHEDRRTPENLGVAVNDGLKAGHWLQPRIMVHRNADGA